MKHIGDRREKIKYQKLQQLGPERIHLEGADDDDSHEKQLKLTSLIQVDP